MRCVRVAIVIIGGLLVMPSPAWPQQDDVFRQEQERMRSSPLYERARAAGGNLAMLQDPNPAALYTDLASLYKASNLVVLVHIDRNACKLSPSGAAPITEYTATLIREFKSFVAPTIKFSIPTGMISFDANTRASVSVRGFLPLADGKRYLLFLRSAADDKGRFDSGFRLTGDGVQGAFEITDDKVSPNFVGDPLWQKYRGAPAATLLADVEPFTNAAINAAKNPTLGAGTPMPGMSDTESLWYLTVGKLQAVGLHFPSYMPTIWQMKHYLRESLSTHQKVTVSWDSLPGVIGTSWASYSPPTVRCETVQNVPLSPDFVLVDRKHSIPHAPGTGIDSMIASDFLVEVGTTLSSEIRSFSTVPDPRINPYEGCSIIPRITFDVFLPDDPEIKSVVFFKPDSMAGPGVVLQKIGTLSIPSN